MNPTDDLYGPPRLERAAVIAALAMLAAIELVAASRIGFAFEYPLDDVYIHLAMASEIARGGYGVNSGEYASAASSALYPWLLTPFPDSEFQRWLPLIWNTVGLVLTAWLWARALIWAGYRGALGWMLAILGPLFVGAVSTAYVGMEHSLHAAATLAVVFGLARYLSEGRLNTLLFLGLFFSPLLRFEGLALCTMVVLILATDRRPVAAAIAFVLSFVPIGIFIWYLTSLGLDPLPNSVQAKLTAAGDLDFNRFERAIGTVQINLAKFGGLSIGLLVVTVLFLANLTSAGLNRAPALAGLMLGAVGIVALTCATFGQGRQAPFFGPAIGALLVGVVVLAAQLFRGLRDGTAMRGPVFLALALAAAGIGHVVLAQTGWMERYEHYAIAGIGLGALILAGHAETARRAAVTLAVIAVAFSGARYGYKSVVQYPWSSRAIHLQQYQMARFAKEFLKRNVAVNDLGWVVWGNPDYVLDLYGLANDEARSLRIAFSAPGWGGPLVKAHDVSVIMMYADNKLVGQPQAPEWVPLGKLVMKNPRGYLGGAEVTFYAANQGEVAQARAALVAWKPTLLPDTCFVLEGDSKCWN